MNKLQNGSMEATGKVLEGFVKIAHNRDLPFCENPALFENKARLFDDNLGLLKLV